PPPPPHTHRQETRPPAADEVSYKPHYSLHTTVHIDAKRKGSRCSGFDTSFRETYKWPGKKGNLLPEKLVRHSQIRRFGLCNMTSGHRHLLTTGRQYENWNK
ncbi:hypothetical protein RvY_01588-4, partial [Ramazzottius varieornatus]